jgi:hypothetical protein
MTSTLKYWIIGSVECEIVVVKDVNPDINYAKSFGSFRFISDICSAERIVMLKWCFPSKSEVIFLCV